MSNLEKEFANHNQKRLQNSNETTEENIKSCNCRSQANGPINGECLTKGIKQQLCTLKRKIFTMYQLKDNLK